MIFRRLIICYFISLTATAQFSPEAFLSAAVSDIELEEIQAAQDFVKNNKFNSPWLRELEFRAKSNDREIGLEDYRLRFGFINPYEISANKKYRQELDQTIQLRKQMKLNDVLKMRYDLLIEQVYLSSQIRNAEELEEFYRRLRVLVYQNERDNLKEEILDLEDRLFKQRSKLYDLEQKLNINQYLIKEKLTDTISINIDINTLITYEYIFEHLNTQENNTNLHSQLATQETNLRESRFTVEKAESYRNIGFFQAEYDMERGDELADQLGYRIGVTIPIFNPDKPDLQRDRLSIVENEAKQKRRINQNQRYQDILEMDFQHIKRQMILLEQELKFMTQFEAAEGQLSLDLLRKSTEFRFLLENRKMGLYTLLLNKFIDSLYQRGILVSSPMVNHISRNLLPLTISLE